MTSALGISLPETWSTCPLKHVTSLLKRGSAPAYVDDGPVRVVSQAANQDAGLDWSRTRFHEFDGDLRNLKGHLLPSDILINSTGTGTLGRVGYFPGGLDALPCMADSHITIARAKNDELHPRFAYYWLNSHPFQEYVYAALVVGATNQIELNRERLGDAPVPMPTMGEQRRIAHFLDAETARIDRLQSLQSRQVSLLSAHHLSRISEISVGQIKEHGSIRLRHLLMGIEQGWSPQCDDRLAESEEWGVIKAGCVHSGEFDELQHKALPEGVEPRLEYALNPGDLLVSRASGSPELIGSAGIVQEIRANLLLCDKVYRLAVDRTRARPEFIVYMLRSHAVREHIKNGISGAEGMANNLPTPVIKDCILPDASLEKQGDIVAELKSDREATARARSALQRSISLIAERRQALITAAVTGQIDVSTASGRGIED